MSVYKLAAAGTGGTQNGIAQVDVQFDGIITAIHGTLEAGLAAGGNTCAVEASFLSVNTLGTNDTRGSLWALRLQMLLAGAAYATLVNESSNVGGLAIAVNAGERLWMHIIATAAIASAADVYIYVEDGQGVPTAQRRR